MLHRVKQLTKEAAKRSNSNSLTPACHAIAQSCDVAPDVLPHNTLKHQPTIRKPSLFHPSNIQSSSTPMKDAVICRPAVGGSSLLLDAENDPPISGHHISSSSGSSANHNSQPLDPVSPIHDQAGRDKIISISDDKIGIVKSSGNEAKSVEQEQAGNHIHGMSEPPDLSDAKQPLTLEGGKKARDRETSPCSCRSLNSSFVTGHHRSALMEADGSFSSGSGKPRMQNVASTVYHPMSSDSQQLFAETKARMANARTNISEFIQSEKTRTANSSFVSWPATILDNRDVGRVTTGINRHVLTTNESHASGSLEQSIGKLSLAIQSLGNVGFVNFDDEVTCPSPISKSCDTARSVDKLPLPVHSSENAGFAGLDKLTFAPDDAAVEMTSSSCRDDKCQPENNNSGGRSWAEILEQATDRSTSRHIITSAVPLPDLSCSGDDVVTPAMLDSLKARIRELKHRQEQLEHQQLLFTVQDYPAATSRTNQQYSMPDYPVTSATSISFPTFISSVVNSGIVFGSKHGLEHDQVLSTTQDRSVNAATMNPFPATSSVMNPGVISGGSKHGADLSSSAVPSVSVKAGGDDPSKNRPQSTSAARSLVSEFTKLPATSSEILRLRDPLPLDVASHTSSDSHAVVVSTVGNGSGSYSQNPATSSNSNHLQTVGSYMPAVSVAALQQLGGGKTMVTTISVADGPTNSCNPRSLSTNPTAVPLNSMPSQPKDDNLRTCVPSDEDLDPAAMMTDIGSVNPTTRLSTVQPVSMVSSNEVVTAGGLVANTVLVSSCNAGSITTAAVGATGTSILSSYSYKNLGPFQSAVTNATTVDGVALAWLSADSRPNSLGRKAESSSTTSTLNGSVLNPTKVSGAVISQKFSDQQSSRASSVSSAVTIEKTTVQSLQAPTFIPPTPTFLCGGNTESSHSDNSIVNSQHVIGNAQQVVDNSRQFIVDASSEFPVPACSCGSGMIQQSVGDEQRQQMRLVFKPFVLSNSYLCLNFFLIFSSECWAYCCYLSASTFFRISQSGFRSLA